MTTHQDANALHVTGRKDMHIGFIGLGSVVETAYFPALRRLELPDAAFYGFDIDPLRQPEGVIHCASIEALLAKPLDVVFVTTSSINHLAALELALASPARRIVVEKPVCADLEQIARLKSLLAAPEQAARVLALDHWTARSVALRHGFVDPVWQGAQGQAQALHFELADVLRLEGVLQEVSGFNQQGEPIALNFATGLPDTRQLRHPDGVIVDIGTHVLALLREIVHHLGGADTIQLQLLEARDRLGQPIARGDLQTAEGEALLRGQLAGIPVDIRLNKYAGPAGGQKGIRIYLRDGRVISQDRSGNFDVVEVRQGEQALSWRLAGPVYDHCLRGLLSGDDLVDADAIAAQTRRRIAEVDALLQIQHQLRGPAA